MLGKKKKEHISNRLASITSSAPKVSDVRIPEPKKRGPPERAKREPVFRPGKLYISKSNFLRCVIRNVSDSGAYVHIEGVHPLPETVVLRFDQTGVIKKARVAWQNEIEAGLEYLKDMTPSDAPKG
ncbi:PilZ domain-containing protein [Hyphococcus flavus]|uniref:PilZ domain-containing protein n=1 Tax=Hyphococcus flavus TaxID=1866326 RepID=A0AAE9ZB07_9PROT|nr:PilZ domain-containing protein [Hyphococcus flavus]WDI30616.1 PilZ domain-containing protein [Hyphococcus flavus]